MKRKIIKGGEPKNGDTYYYIDGKGFLNDTTDENWSGDNFRYKTRNYFKTKEEVETYLDNINTYYDLMDLAEELNNGEEINWKNKNQIKYCICYDYYGKKLECGNTWSYKKIGAIYCSATDFFYKAKERIGEDRLIKLFKGV